MTVNDAADHLRALLLDAGFDTECPDVELAWEVFKRFASETVDAHTTEVWFEAADGVPASDLPAYFDFVRMFMHYPEEGAEWGEQITAHFTAPPSVQLGLQSGSIQGQDIADLSAWFAAVESSQSFRTGSKFTGWSFEVRIDGC